MLQELFEAQGGAFEVNQLPDKSIVQMIILPLQKSKEEPGS
jgi:hypothetical protein